MERIDVADEIRPLVLIKEAEIRDGIIRIGGAPGGF
jgi:hypothetical protein